MLNRGYAYTFRLHGMRRTKRVNHCGNDHRGIYQRPDLNGFVVCPPFIGPVSNECRAKVEQKLDEVFKQF